MAKPITFMPEIDLQVGGTASHDLTRWTRQVGLRSASVTRHFGLRLQTDVRSRARRLFDVTDYDQSIWLKVRGTRATVGSNAAHANRLEYGFVGVDSAGRHVAQPPRPHFRPALERARSDYVRAIREVVK